MGKRRRNGYRHGLLILPMIAALSLMAGCDTDLTNGGLPGGSTQEPGGAQGSGVSGSGASPSVQATLLEQLSLERINRARLLPGAEADAAGIAIDEGIPGQLDDSPRQPLAMNPDLRESALLHSEDMLDRDYFAHNTPEGLTPFDRMQDAGYTFITAGENLAWRGSTGTLDPVSTIEAQHDDLFIDRGIDGRGHRVTMLAGQFREVGIGIVRGSFTRQSDGVIFSDSFMQTQDFGTTPASGTFVLGVVYTDANDNGRYDHGEGVPSFTVTLEDVSRPTNEAGGYSFEIFTPGAYTLRFASGHSHSLLIDTGDPNIKIDWVGSNIVVNLGLGPLD